MRDILSYIIGGAGGLVVGILIGAVLMAGFGFVQGGGTNVPYDTNHSDIANSVRVQDKQFNVNLTLHHLQTGPVEFDPFAPQTFIYDGGGGGDDKTLFPPHLQTTQSIWSFTSGGDIDVYMRILGPGSDGHTYNVDFNRLTGSETIITCGSQTVHWYSGEYMNMYRNIHVQR